MDHITLDFQRNGTDFMVEVEYDLGYYRPGSRRGHPDHWTPDEGEATYVSKVIACNDRGEPKKDITRLLSSQELRELGERIESIHASRAGDRD